MSELQPVENYLEYGDVIDNIIITTDDDGDSDGDEGLRWSSGLYKEPPTEQPSKLDVPSISLRYMQPGVHPDILTRRTWAQS